MWQDKDGHRFYKECDCGIKKKRNEGKPTIGALARQLYNECQIKLCEHEVEILRKYSLFEEGDPYD